MRITKTVVFAAGDEGYPMYRIPALALLGDGTLLAFAEARRDPLDEHGGDWAASGLAMRRSEDGGKSWSAQSWLDSNQNGPTHNPTPIADRENPHTLHLLYQKDYARAFYTRTDDSGRTWTPARDITDTFLPVRRDYDWLVIATGPGHGVTLDGGRMLTPVWFARDESAPKNHRPSRVGAVYSDDGGESWRCGELVDPLLLNPSEAQAAQLADGRVLMSIRSEEDAFRRALSHSCDGGKTWSIPMLHPQLWDPICCAGLIKVPSAGGKTLVFTAPDTQKEHNDPENPRRMRSGIRCRLTARLSEDDGLTWPRKRAIEEGASGYSDLAAAGDGTVFCLYECGGEGTSPGRIELAVFNAGWIKGE